jgi:hypothetical protein
MATASAVGIQGFVAGSRAFRAPLQPEAKTSPWPDDQLLRSNARSGYDPTRPRNPGIATEGALCCRIGANTAMLEA